MRSNLHSKFEIPSRWKPSQQADFANPHISDAIKKSAISGLESRQVGYFLLKILPLQIYPSHRDYLIIFWLKSKTLMVRLIGSWQWFFLCIRFKFVVIGWYLCLQTTFSIQRGDRSNLFAAFHFPPWATGFATIGREKKHKKTFFPQLVRQPLCHQLQLLLCLAHFIIWLIIPFYMNIPSVKVW